MEVGPPLAQLGCLKFGSACSLGDYASIFPRHREIRNHPKMVRMVAYFISARQYLEQQRVDATVRRRAPPTTNVPGERVTDVDVELRRDVANVRVTRVRLLTVACVWRRSGFAQRTAEHSCSRTGHKRRYGPDRLCDLIRIRSYVWSRALKLLRPQRGIL